MTIELINSNYNDLITLINADITSIKAEPNSFIKARNRDSAIAQVNEIIILINKEYDNSIIAIDYENNETEYYCEMDATEHKLKPFMTALKELKTI